MCEGVWGGGGGRITQTTDSRPELRNCDDFFTTKSTSMSNVKMLYHGIYFCDEVFFVKTLPFPSPKNGEEILKHYTDIGEIPFTRACRSVLWVGINYLIVRTHIY